MNEFTHSPISHRKAFTACGLLSLSFDGREHRYSHAVSSGLCVLRLAGVQELFMVAGSVETSETVRVWPYQPNRTAAGLISLLATAPFPASAWLARKLPAQAGKREKQRLCRRGDILT